MANNRVYTESVVTLNNQEAAARIDELRKKALDLRDVMAKLAQEKGINSKEFKAAQKELMSVEKSITDISENTKKFEKILNNLNGASLNELQSAARKLNQQVRRLKPGTDEFVAASKKLKDVRTRMKEIEGQTKDTQKLFGGFFTKIGWAGLVAGALSLFKKFASDMIAQTQLVGDKWKFETAGWKAAYGSFVADLSSGRGWNEMIQRMKDAYKNGKEVAKRLDEIFERNNSMTLQEAELNNEAEKQKKIYMDGTKSVQERIAAAEEYDRIQQQIAQTRKDVAAEEYEAYKSQLQQRTELSDAELDLFIRDYNQNKELIDQVREYAEKVQDYESKISATRKAAMFDRDIYSTTSHNQQIQAYQDELDVFKATADESVVYWSEIVAKYDLGNDEMVKNYVQARQKMVDADTGYERATQRSSRVTANLKKQLATEGQSAVNKAYQDDIKKSDERYKTLQLQAKQAYVDGTLTEQQYQARLTEIQEESLKDRLAIAERHKQSTIEFQSQLLDLSVKQKQELEKLMTDLQNEADKALKEALDNTEKEISEFVSSLDDEMKEFIDQWQEMCDKADEIRRELDPVEALRSDMAAALAEAKDLYESNLLSEEEYQKKRADIVQRYNKEILETQLEPYQQGVQNAQKYLDQCNSFMESLQEAASARLEARMQAELTAAGDNAEQREEIEAGYEQKKLDLQKRYANINMGIEIAKTIAAGALSVMQGFAELGPIAGAVFAALIAATTAAQVAVIVQQRNAIMNTSVDSSGKSSQIGQRVATGYSGGGYTEKRSNDYQEVGVVHANEWIAPAAMVRAYPVTFASLEAVRKSGNYRSGIPGFADGGSAGDAVPVQVPVGTDTELLQKACDLMQQLLDSLPFPTYMVLSELNAKQEVVSTIKSVTKR